MRNAAFAVVLPEFNSDRLGRLGAESADYSMYPIIPICLAGIYAKLIVSLGAGSVRTTAYRSRR